MLAIPKIIHSNRKHKFYISQSGKFNIIRGTLAHEYGCKIGYDENRKIYLEKTNPTIPSLN